MRLTYVAALCCVVPLFFAATPVRAQNAADASAQGASTDPIVKMHERIAAANQVYERKVAAAKKVYDRQKAAAAKERDAAVQTARYGVNE
nr:hypothetical protein [Paraburkholderia phosphatilytica]